MHIKEKIKLLKPYVIIYLFLILIATPFILGRGIFFDGLTYSSIARNMAEGSGSFLKPHYTKTLYNNFYESMPLQFIIQSYFFKIFGDKRWVEQLYGLLITFFTILFFILFLQELEKAVLPESTVKERKFRLLWATFLLLSVPAFTHATMNNLLENTVTFFVVLGSYSTIKSFNVKSYQLWAFLSGLFIFCAMFSKSVMGLFPLIIYPAAGLILNMKGWFKRWLYQILGFAIFLFSIMLIPAGKHYILIHLKKQVLASIEGTREVSKNRFILIPEWLQEISIPLVIAIILSRIKKWKLGKLPLFLLVIGFLGFLPLMISQKVMRRYIVPSLPFFAAAIAYISCSTKELLGKKPFLFLYKISIPVLILGIIILAIFSSGKIRKNTKQWNEVMPVWNKLQPYKKRIVVDPYGFKPSWEDIAFYQRYFKWSFGKGDYILERIGSKSKNTDKTKLKLLVDGTKIKLYEK